MLKYKNMYTPAPSGTWVLVLDYQALASRYWTIGHLGTWALVTRYLGT